MNWSEPWSGPIFSGDLIIIGLNSGLSPTCHQDTTWTSNDLYPWNIMAFQGNLLEIHIFIVDNVFEIIVCKMLSILFMP